MIFKSIRCLYHVNKFFQYWYWKNFLLRILYLFKIWHMQYILHMTFRFLIEIFILLCFQQQSSKSLHLDAFDWASLICNNWMYKMELLKWRQDKSNFLQIKHVIVYEVNNVQPERRTWLGLRKLDLVRNSILGQTTQLWTKKNPV